MVYILTFNHKGKSYSASEALSGKYEPQQYEAAACGLILGKIDREGLSRTDIYRDVCLLEYDEKEKTVINPVWCAESYVPDSKELKL